MVTGCIGQSCRIHRFLGEHQARWQHDHLRGKHGKAQRCCEETQAHGQRDTSKGIWPNEPPYPPGHPGYPKQAQPICASRGNTDEAQTHTLGDNEQPTSPQTGLAYPFTSSWTKPTCPSSSTAASQLGKHRTSPISKASQLHFSSQTAA